MINISFEALQKFSCHFKIVIVSLIQGTIAEEQRWICCQLARELLIAYLLKGPFRFYHMLVKGNCIILNYGSGITCSPSLRSVCRLRGKLAEALFYIFVFVYERLTEKKKVGAFLGFNCLIYLCLTRMFFFFIVCKHRCLLGSNDSVFPFQSRIPTSISH